MIKGARKIYLGGTPVKKVMLGLAMIHPSVVSTELNVHYDTGANTYQGWDRYNLYHYRDVLTWSDTTTTYTNTRSANILTRANAYTEVNTLKSQGTSFWSSGWDKYRTDTYQILRTREDNHQEWVGIEEQVSVLVQSDAYTLGGYYHESSTSTVCVNYGVAPYQTGCHRIMARNRIRFDGYQEVNDRHTEANWLIVANNVEACGYSPKQNAYFGVLDGLGDSNFVQITSASGGGHYLNVGTSVEVRVTVAAGKGSEYWDTQEDTTVFIPKGQYGANATGYPHTWVIINIVNVNPKTTNQFNFIY